MGIELLLIVESLKVRLNGKRNNRRWAVGKVLLDQSLVESRVDHLGQTILSGSKV
jgi:hypothetical protein